MAEKISFETLKELDFKTNEAYKRVRTNITFSGEDIRVISITSSVPNEGKSSVSFNLARSFAEDGRKTLYIDADIRKSVTIARYGVDRETQGLTHFLSGQVKQLEDVIYETDVDNLDVIFTGAKAPNPAELLGLEKFRKMMSTLREAYDYIIIDCPPLGSVIDAVLISRATDGTILVIESDNLSYKLVQSVKRELEQNNCKILGVILNKVEMGGKGYYGYYGGYYGYSDYYGYGNEDSKKGSSEKKKSSSSSSGGVKKSRHTRTFDTGVK
ncbi:MAG: CpsD/CapB family tyrosine-protein kinase [Eubacterium sp.]|nr:CpsD/CapB family tyrosine-protein kinase [Eubacterium sp.]